MRDELGDDGAVHVAVGAVVSITMSLFEPSEPVAPGEGSVSVALFPAESLIVPPLRAKEVVAT